MPQKLGKHFLKNKRTLRDIADLVEIKNGETVIEIGSGHGELSNFLIEDCLKKNTHLIMIEKDRRLANILKEKLMTQPQSTQNEKIIVIEGDILKQLPEISEKVANYKLVGNIPYYITGRLFRILEGLNNKPKKTVLTIQKEVALRVIAAKEKLNKLAASVQFWGEAEIKKIIPPEEFSPPPKVTSAVIVIRPKLKKPKINRGDYFQAVKIIFKQPRKTVLNNVAESANAVSKDELVKILTNLKIDPRVRPERLSLKDIIAIAQNLKALIKLKK